MGYQHLSFLNVFYMLFVIGAIHFVVNTLRAYGNLTRTDLDQVCARNMIPAAKCIETKLETCDANDEREEVVDGLRAVSRLMKDACTFYGKWYLMEMQKSSCSQSETYLDILMTSVKTCYVNKLMEIFETTKALKKGEEGKVNHCPLLKDIARCIYLKTYFQCGGVYARVVKHVLGVMWEEMMPEKLECSTALYKTRYATRALESLKEKFYK